MPKRALIESRPWLLASIALAIAYYFLRSQPLEDDALIVLKGGAVACLAAYAWQRRAGSSGLLLALVMALGAAGDMLIELSLRWGGAAFFAGHLAAVALYLGNRHRHPSADRKLMALALLVATPVVCWLLSRDAAVTLYGLGLGMMAATAWLSRFSRARVGLGAVLFVLSDWLIFARMGPFDTAALSALLVWPLYVAGQFLIATGVVQTLRHELPAED